MKTIQKMYEHLNWANRRILETLQSIEDENQRGRQYFSHILLAEKVWITRLQGSDSSQLPIWSEIDIEVCAELVKQNEESFTAFLTNVANTDLDKIISYTNSKGKEFTNSVRDILTHVALHGQYHRGQINSRLRAEGVEPVTIDFITLVRTKP
ncbi:putative damage-inducible protein DinB [Aneurinibacillus soli]|uniref:DinB family protein n=1 Tax=Aneurinibacillus soli TaxID=1500254 RepID=A0A0U5BCU7_9BACL|nr:DinB family protein [Aneurinibacillus soli]PYE57382.1 putative damage-inducible protein DinB [Aneurinibacillus soli]BAU28780.1 DinB family protein [Aneurinibacillus soli]